MVGLFNVGYKLFPGSVWLFQIAVSVSLLGFAAGCVSSPIISLVIETMENQLQKEALEAETSFNIFSSINDDKKFKMRGRSASVAIHDQLIAEESSQEDSFDSEQKTKSDIKEKSFTVVESAFAVGTLVGPILGGALYDMGRFNFAALCIASLGSVTGIALVVVARATRDKAEIGL